MSLVGGPYIRWLSVFAFISLAISVYLVGTLLNYYLLYVIVALDIIVVTKKFLHHIILLLYLDVINHIVNICLMQ